MAVCITQSMNTRSRHTKIALATAAIINMLIVAGEAFAGYHANSLSIAVDAVHNCSDELALILLFLAYWRSDRFAGRLGSMANLLNSLGIVVLTIAIVALAARRILEPPAVSGSITMTAGLTAAVGNLAVALALRRDALDYPEVRLAYLHNLGDVALCLSTAGSGLFIMMFNSYWLDCAFAVCVATILLICTAREFLQTPNAQSDRAYMISDTQVHVSDVTSR